VAAPPCNADSSVLQEGRQLVLTSRYREETALRALRSFASFAFNVSRSDSLRKARKVPQSSRRRMVSKEDRPYGITDSSNTRVKPMATILLIVMRRQYASVLVL